jgi:DNA-binding NarL/FixJ family response regulator
MSVFNEHVYLYVEDDPLSREAIRVVLTRVMGVERLWVFEDSDDFMHRVKALDHAPDVILLDIQVAPYNGFDMLAMLRRDPVFRTARVVALTASVMNEEVAMLQESGFDGAIGKPINVATFPGVIEQIIHGKSVWYITGA